MNRSPIVARAMYGLLVVSYALILFGIGRTLKAASDWELEWFFPIPVFWAFVLLTPRAMALRQLPAMVRNCRWLLLRPVILFELAGVAALVGGLWYGSQYPAVFREANRDLVFREANRDLMFFGLPGIIGFGVATYFATRESKSKMPVVSSGFFLFAHGHYDDFSSRRQLAAVIAHALLVSATLTLLLRGAPDDWAATDRAQSFAIAVVVAMLLTALQVNPIRGLCFVPFGFFALVVAALAHAIAPSADWPATIAGIGAGLPVGGLTTALLMLVPPTQRYAAILIAGVLTIAAGLLGFAVTFLPAVPAAWSVAAFALVIFAYFLRLYFREFAEIIQEIVHWPMYRFKAYGPGLVDVPTRGPVLIIANHGAYFDPLFVAKVLPMRVRAWMISTMFDKPFLTWLAGRVYGAIRVPDRPGFRRHMPEIDQAIEVLKNGENMMIFPEAWLRRKEEQPLHRFAQGIVHILKACPNVPILPAWIEDSWGSYLSYKNGPPTKGKPFDFFYLIRMGFGEPEVLPPELLEDQKATRKYLMERVLHCRTYLGLPAYPVPGLTSVEDEKDGDQANLAR